MHSLTTFFLSFLLLPTSVLSAVVALPSSTITADIIPSYLNGGPMSFSGTLSGLEGITITANGTAQQIIAQAQLDHPGWTPIFDHNHVQSPSIGGTGVAARGAEYKFGLMCWPVPGQSWERCNNYELNIAMDFLHVIKGITAIDGNHCRLISCNQNAGIHVCNDNSYTIFPNTEYLASYAFDIQSNCQSNGGPNGLVCGQELDTDRYNVIVKKTDCGNI